MGTPEYIREAQFSLREVSVITDNDPKAQRIFDLQKYGLEAGLSKEYIDKGIQSIKNDDWDAQKNIYRDIIDGMAKNPNWSVAKLTEAELNVAVLEDKAIQEAVQIANDGAATRLQVNQIINEKISPYQELANLNPNKLAGFTALNRSGTYISVVPAYYIEEQKAFNNELDKLVKSNADINLYNQEINELKSQIDQLNVKNSEISGKMMNEYNWLNGALNSAKEHIKNYESIGGYLNREKIFLRNANVVNPEDLEELATKLNQRRIDNILRGDTEAARQIQEYKDYKHSKMYL